MKPLEALLDEVGHAVRKADYAALANLAPDLEMSLAQAEAAGGDTLPRQRLELLKQKADINALLLDAARRGMLAARRRLDEVRRAARGLQTYDMRGQRSEIVTSTTTAGRF